MQSTEKLNLEESPIRLEEPFCIPATARNLRGFRSWAGSAGFPSRGRIDYLSGDLEVDMSPEDLYTHGTVKVAIAAELYFLVTQRGLGSVFTDHTRVSAPAAELSVEPDVVVLLWETVDSGRVREVPSAGGRPGRFIELEGAPDLIVEIVSDGSIRKDLRRLPPLYAAAAVPEIWLVDARGGEIRFTVHKLGAGGYREAPKDAEGWTPSSLLGLRFRLVRHSLRPGRPQVRLEHLDSTEDES